ncbi:hypothetical protein [Streptomyces sp. TRM49041]|uniref:hypothetical protein n=1 Tax=Streptomyces sp. TRM49041 TaxID=2603216 RepID=UPI0011EF4652|nr:hypothetical protein [Streptomyces sp. TRM49041]
MPRPTAAQLAYGSATVVCSTVALLLLFPTTTGAGIALVGAAALLLGLSVTLAAPLRARVRARARARGAGTGAGAATPDAAPERQPSLRR